MPEEKEYTTEETYEFLQSRIISDERKYTTEETYEFMRIYDKIKNIERISYTNIASTYDYSPEKLERLLEEVEKLPEELRDNSYKKCYDTIIEAIKTSKDFRKAERN